MQPVLGGREIRTSNPVVDAMSEARAAALESEIRADNAPAELHQRGVVITSLGLCPSGCRIAPRQKLVRGPLRNGERVVAQPWANFVVISLRVLRVAGASAAVTASHEVTP